MGKRKKGKGAKERSKLFWNGNKGRNEEKKVSGFLVFGIVFFGVSGGRVCLVIPTCVKERAAKGCGTLRDLPCKNVQVMPLMCCGFVSSVSFSMHVELSGIYEVCHNF